MVQFLLESIREVGLGAEKDDAALGDYELESNSGVHDRSQRSTHTRNREVTEQFIGIVGIEEVVDYVDSWKLATDCWR